MPAEQQGIIGFDTASRDITVESAATREFCERERSAEDSVRVTTAQHDAVDVSTAVLVVKYIAIVWQRPGMMCASAHMNADQCHLEQAQCVMEQQCNGGNK